MRMQKRIRLAVAALLLWGGLAFVQACQNQAAREAQTSSSARDTVQQARLVEGQRAYLANCAMCHGEWGDGDGPAAATFRKHGSAVVADLNDPARLDSLGRIEVVRVIERGGAHTGRSNLMPAWGEKLPRDVIDHIADFVMALPSLHPGIPPATMTKYLESPPGMPAEGRRLYVALCVACHGPFGRGDGPFADTLWARSKMHPRDLTDSTYFARKTDRELFATVSMGGGYFHRSPYMPAWAVSLTPEQIKHLVSYVRLLSRTPPQL